MQKVAPVSAAPAEKEVRTPLSHMSCFEAERSVRRGASGTSWAPRLQGRRPSSASPGPGERSQGIWGYQLPGSSGSSWTWPVPTLGPTGHDRSVHSACSLFPVGTSLQTCRSEHPCPPGRGSAVNAGEPDQTLHPEALDPEHSDSGQTAGSSLCPASGAPAGAPLLQAALSRPGPGSGPGPFQDAPTSVPCFCRNE